MNWPGKIWGLLLENDQKSTLDSNRIGIINNKYLISLCFKLELGNIGGYQDPHFGVSPDSQLMDSDNPQ